jgi:cytochrome c oxidase assembly protein subunit 19
MIQARFKATPPAKGSFPLDHLGECAALARQYLSCIEHPETGGFNRTCKPLAKEYLMCRMDRGLMSREDPSKLGFKTQYSVDEQGRELGHDRNKGRVVLPESLPNAQGFIPFVSTDRLVPAPSSSKEQQE